MLRNDMVLDSLYKHSQDRHNSRVTDESSQPPTIADAHRG